MTTKMYTKLTYLTFTADESAGVLFEGQAESLCPTEVVVVVVIVVVVIIAAAPPPEAMEAS
jgi:hypothetical protein